MKNRKFGENYLFSHPKTEAQTQLNEGHAIVTRSHLEAVNKYLNSLPDKEKVKIDQEISFLDSNGTSWPMRGERMKVGDDEGVYSHFDVTRCKCVATFPGGSTERLDPSDLKEIKSPKELPLSLENYKKEGVICKTIEGDLARIIFWHTKSGVDDHVIGYWVDNDKNELVMGEYRLENIPLILTLPEPTEKEPIDVAMNWIIHLPSDVKCYLSNKHFNTHPTQLSKVQFKEIWEREGCQEYANSGDEASESVASTESAPMGSEQDRANKWWCELPSSGSEDKAVNRGTLSAKFFSCPVEALTADNVLFIWKEVAHNICEKCKGVGRKPSRFEGTELCHRCGGDGYHKKISL